MSDNVIPIIDQKERELALNIAKSFIVEAPAGSGKTELLIRRYLKLIDSVDNPEEILAITFTKKAAGEMLTRIINNLKKDINNPKYRKIIDNPNQLKIMTIDAFCAFLSKKMPVLSGIGSFCDIAENAEYLYKTAVRNFLKNIKEADYKKHIENLLLALDNRFDLFESFLVKMLGTRDKWMPYIYSVSELINQDEIINTIKEIKKNSTYQIEKIISKDDIEELESLLGIIVDNILTNDIKSSQAKQILKNHESNEKLYITLSYILFTGDDKLSFRKRFDKNLGLPTSAKDEKKIISGIIEKYRVYEKDLSEIFSLLRLLPDDYHQAEIDFISSLCKILPLLVANLKVVFQNFLKIDFIEVTQAALNALGDELNPTDLALVIDYKINHILFDEFQDTSLTHFRLLKKIISEWNNNSGKSLFIVGDPKQSIYRFRNAEVSLFMEVALNGIFNLDLEYIKLKTNFRSKNNIVSFVNKVFNKSFPQKIDALFGAIPYSNSNSFDKSLTSEQINLNIFEDDSEYQEEVFIVNNIKKILTSNPQDSIAILIRNRRHARFLIKHLNKNSINFSAVDLDLLYENALIQDLLSLTKAILFLNDRTAWFSVLRAPWCGLLLEDLEILANFDEDSTFIWELINNKEITSNLSTDGQKRLNNFILAFQSAINIRYRVPFYRLIEKLFLDLSGNFFIKSEKEQELICEFFDLLDSFDASFGILNPDEFYSKIEKLYYSSNDTQDCNVQIMTIHKSKGLQFDHVFVPMLHKQSRAREHELLLSQEYHNKEFNGFVLAPFNEYLDINDSESNIYNVLRYIDKQKEYHESIRLLYVAITRAVKNCYLSAVLDEKKLEKGPVRGSLLFCIWDGISLDDIKYYKSAGNNKLDSNLISNKIKNYNFRLSSEYIEYNKNILSKKNIAIDNSNSNKNPSVYLYEDNTFALIGTYVHRLLKTYAEDKNSILDNIFQSNFKNIIFEQLLALGLSNSKLDFAYEVITQVFKNIQNDSKADFIFKFYEESSNEKSFSYFDSKNKLNTIRIDRFFIDPESDVVWIIDYKIFEDFKDNQNLSEYIRQMKLYIRAIKNIYNKEVKAMLYSPYTQAGLVL